MFQPATCSSKFQRQTAWKSRTSCLSHALGSSSPARRHFGRFSLTLQSLNKVGRNLELRELCDSGNSCQPRPISLGIPRAEFSCQGLSATLLQGRFLNVRIFGAGREKNSCPLFWQQDARTASASTHSFSASLLRSPGQSSGE